MTDQSATHPATERYGWGYRIPLNIEESITTTAEDGASWTMWNFDPLDVPGLTSIDIEQQITAQYPNDDGTLLKEALETLAAHVAPTTEQIAARVAIATKEAAQAKAVSVTK